MKEEFLHYIWQSGLYDHHQLQTHDGRAITVVKPGVYNTDSGPDFFNSRIMIENTHWAGNIEVHKASSEWMLHGHQYDSAYNNVILHVVYEHDEEVVNQLGKPIPTLELRSLIPHSLLSKYHTLFNSFKWI